MVSFLKSLQAMFGSIFAELPDGIKVLTSFVWKCRWFIVGGYVSWMVYTLLMKVLPLLMWSFVIKSVLGSVFSLFN